jgi:predicted Zn finger-like uncharacterized protein
LFTVCPKCTLTLVVTTVDLRAGQGYVRCGRCANVFNALIALREGDPSGATSDSTRQRMLETPPRAPIEPAMGAGVALEPESPPEPEPEPAPLVEPEPEPDALLPEQILTQPPPEPESVPESEPGSEPEELVEVGEVSGYELSFDAVPEDAAAEEITYEAVPPSSEDASMEFDATATDVSEIFIAPDAEQNTGSGSYEAVVLAVDPPPAHGSDPDPIVVSDSVDPHTDTIATEDWSLFDEEPQADAESVIEESPLPTQADEETAGETGHADPAWVSEMFAEAEAEAEAKRVRTGERRAYEPAPVPDFAAVEEPDEAPAESAQEPAALRAARDVAGVSAPSGDTVLEPLLAPARPARAAWPQVAGLAALALLLVLQVVHHHRHRLVLSPTVGGAVSTVYGWFGATLTPQWDLTAYTVKQLGAEAEGSEGSRLRVRLSVQNDSARVQPLPLLRLTLQDRFGTAVATRDLEPREYLPQRAADLRLLEPDQRIDAELHVIDPGKAAIGFEIDACLRSQNGHIGCANDARRRAAG